MLSLCLAWPCREWSTQQALETDGLDLNHGLENSFSKLQFLHLENRDDLNLPYRAAKKINEMPMKRSLPFITIPHSGHPWG